MQAWLTGLPPRYARVVSLRYSLAGKPHTQAAIGVIMGVTEQRIYWIVRHAQSLLLRRPLLPWTEVHIDALRHFLEARGGLVPPEQVVSDLPEHLSVGGLDPVVACRLLAEVGAGLRWTESDGPVADTSSVDSLLAIRREARQLAARTSKSARRR